MYINKNLQANMVEDLVGDLSIIGKDAYDSTVLELDKRQVEIDPSELTGLAVSFLRNIGNIKNRYGHTGNGGRSGQGSWSDSQ